MVGPAEPQRFKPLFMNPTVAAMHALTPREFEHFVAYVFRRAGYEVRDVALKFTRGVDLELFSDRSRHARSGGVEVKRFDAGTLVTAQVVQKLMGAPAVRRGNVGKYLITTSGYNKAAYEMAREDSQVFLLDGEQFCRYIRYVGGSRYDDISATNVLIPPDLFAGQRTIRPQAHRKSKILTIANNKGGVGKTTTVRFFAKELAAKGQQVLVIDMDGQGNLTEKLCGVVSSQIEAPHIGGYFAHQYPLGSTVRSTHIDGVSIIPAHPSINLLDSGGAGRPEMEAQFAHDLITTFTQPTLTREKPFDWIILDTPPAISLLTRVALAAADFVLAPARSRESSLSGVRNMLGMMDTMSTLMGDSPKLLGCLLTHWGEDESSRDSLTPVRKYSTTETAECFAQRSLTM